MNTFQTVTLHSTYWIHDAINDALYFLHFSVTLTNAQINTNLVNEIFDKSLNCYLLGKLRQTCRGCGLWLVDLNLTPRVFLRVLRFSSLHKNQVSRQNLCRRTYWWRLSWSGDWVRTPKVTTLNKPFNIASCSKSVNTVGKISAKYNKYLNISRDNENFKECSFTRVDHSVIVEQTNLWSVSLGCWGHYLRQGVTIHGGRMECQEGDFARGIIDRGNYLWDFMIHEQRYEIQCSNKKSSRRENQLKCK